MWRCSWLVLLSVLARWHAREGAHEESLEHTEWRLVMVVCLGILAKIDPEGAFARCRAGMQTDQTITRRERVEESVWGWMGRTRRIIDYLLGCD